MRACCPALAGLLEGPACVLEGEGEGAVGGLVGAMRCSAGGQKHMLLKLGVFVGGCGRLREPPVVLWWGWVEERSGAYWHAQAQDMCSVSPPPPPCAQHHVLSCVCPQVMQSAEGLLRHQRVEHLLLEYSPGIFERNKQLAGLCELPHMLLALTKAGYR
jgi:hypothetical protein